jgi:hypothetical protein
MASTGNPRDIVRDRILRQLYEFNQKSRSPNKVAVLHRDLAKALKESYGYKLQEVASNLDYLIEKGWAKVVTENRTFTTRAGTTKIQSEKRTKSPPLELIGWKKRPSFSRPPPAHMSTSQTLMALSTLAMETSSMLISLTWPACWQKREDR